MNIICYLSKVPDVVWAAIIASFLTLGGVMLTNWGNNKRLLAQLRHDAEERVRERQMTLRREVYFPAVESVSKAYTVLMELPQANMQSDSWKAEVNSISKTLAKIHIVGSDETVTSSTRFSSEFSKALLELTLKKIPLDQLKNHMGILSTDIDKSSQERDRYIALMKEFNIKVLTDQRLWDTLQKNYEFEVQQGEKYTQELRIVTQQYNDMLMNLMEDCYRKCMDIGHLLVPALCAIRAEMDFPFNTDLYGELIENIRVEMENSMMNFIKNIKNLKFNSHSQTIEFGNESK